MEEVGYQYPGYQMINESHKPPETFNEDYSIILESKTQPIIKFNGRYISKHEDTLRFKLYGNYKRPGMKRIIEVDTNSFEAVYFKPFDYNNPEPENIDDIS